MILSNSGGLITIGFGEDARVITQGYGGQFDDGGVILKEKIECKKYLIGVPLLKEDQESKKIKVSLISQEEFIFEIQVRLDSFDSARRGIIIPIENKRFKLIKKILELI